MTVPGQCRQVNPNQGFKWHQDNQNGPIDAFGENKALRWWVTMDETPAGMRCYRQAHDLLVASVLVIFH